MTGKSSENTVEEKPLDSQFVVLSTVCQTVSGRMSMQWRVVGADCMPALGTCFPVSSPPPSLQPKMRFCTVVLWSVHDDPADIDVDEKKRRKKRPWRFERFNMRRTRLADQ